MPEQPQTQQPAPFDFSDLGAKPVSVAPSPIQRTNQPLDFSDLGGKRISAVSATAPAAAPAQIQDSGDTSQDPVQRSEAYKRGVYSQAHSDFSAGNYRKAASDLLGLFRNPDEQGILDVPAGIVKGAGQTVNTISKGISNIAPSVVRPQDVQALGQMEQTNTPGEKVGAGIEGIGEFILGDEALAHPGKKGGMLMCSVGGKPTEVKVRNLVAWIAGKRETKSLAIDKAIFRMVSKSSGRNDQ